MIGGMNQEGRVPVSINGTIQFYTDAPLQDPPPTRALLGAVGMEVVHPVRANVFLYEVSDRAMETIRSLESRGLMTPEAELIRGVDVAVVNIAAFMRAGKCVTMDPINMPGGEEFASAVADAISPEVRDTFMPCDIDFTFGPHDLFDTVEYEDWHLFGHSRFTVSIFGYGAPGHWKRYREEVFQVPYVKEFKARFEAVVGPLQTCASWTF